MSVLHQNSGGIGKSIPSALKISLDPRDFPRASPSGNLLVLGKLGGGDGFPNTSLVLVEHGYIVRIYLLSRESGEYKIYISHKAEVVHVYL